MQTERETVPSKFSPFSLQRINLRMLRVNNVDKLIVPAIERTSLKHRREKKVSPSGSSKVRREEGGLPPPELAIASQVGEDCPEAGGRRGGLQEGCGR